MLKKLLKYTDQVVSNLAVKLPFHYTVEKCQVKTPANISYIYSFIHIFLPLTRNTITVYRNTLKINILFFSELASGRNPPNPAILLVPGAVFYDLAR